MADKKISQLTTLAQADVAPTADFLPIVDTGSTETKKATPEAVVLGTLANTTANVGIGGSLGTTPSLNRGVYLQSNTNNHVIGYSLYINDGANNRRGSMFLDDSVGVWGWDVTASSGTPAYVWRSAATEQMRLDTSGNLGIGTASPGKNLEVAAATDTTIRIRNTTTNLSSAVYGTLDWATSDSSAPGGIVAKIDTFDDFSGSGFGDRAALRFFTNNAAALAERMRITSAGSIVAGASAALATNATDGFLYVPTCAGTPTGTPTAITGMAPIVVNTTNNKLYFYSGGAWRDAGP